MASRKNDQRRLQALNKQRERLQMEHDALEAEVRQLVRPSRSSVLFHTDYISRS